MGTKLTENEIKKVADLSNLSLSEIEVSKMSDLLNDTLEKIRVLDELDIANVHETYQISGLTNVFMAGNENEATLKVEDALSNAKKVEKGLFETSAVFDRPQ